MVPTANRAKKSAKLSKTKKRKKSLLSKKKAELEVSAGGILYTKRRGQIKVVLVGQFKPFVTWRLPKGHRERGESLLDTATREVREESGVFGTGGPKLGSANFYFIHPVTNKFIHKFVHYYLFKKKSGTIADHDREHGQTARWFTMTKAIKAATFKNDKIMLKRAAAMIKKRQAAGKKTKRSTTGKSLDLGIYQAGSEKD